MTEQNDERMEEVGPEELELSRRLEDQRPLPSAGFRGALARRLSAADPGYGPRPQHLRMSTATYLGAGAGLIAIGALIATGAL